MEAFWRDLKQSFRSLRMDPGLSVIVILTLALGIGGNAAILGVAEATFFGRLPFPGSDRILRLQASYRRPDGSVSRVTIRSREFNVLREMTASQSGPFSSMVGLEDINETLTGVETPERLTVIRCTPGWSGALALQPILGRWFTSEEEKGGDTSNVAVISHELWQRRFGGAAGALGRTMTLDGRTYSIIGVFPAGFRFPYDAEAWISTSTPPDNTREYAVFGRLKPGLTLLDSEQALNFAAEEVRRQYPDTPAGFGFAQITLLQNLQDNQENAALALLGVAGFFLLLACANVANLLLARSVARQREEEIRAALGASRWQQMRRRLVESVLLSSAGTVVGFVLAGWMGGWLDALVPSNFTRQLGMRAEPADPRVLFAAAGIGLAGGLLAGLLPALKSARAHGEFLARETTRTGRSRREKYLMDAFVVVQFALALALLAGAGMMIRNFGRLTHRDLGFDASRLLTMRVSTSAPRYADAAAKRILVRQIIQQIQSAPGVSAASVTTANPLGPSTWLAPVVVPGQEGSTATAGMSNLVNHRLVTPEFFRAMGIALRRGRLFTEGDNENSAPVVVVSERLAKKFWPNTDAVGQRIRINRTGEQWITVVGVVGDVYDFGEPDSPRETWYLPYAQFANTPAASFVYLMVRSLGDPRSVTRATEQAVWRVDRDLALFDNSTMDRDYLESLSQDRLSAIMISVLAGFGLLLGALGVYGALSFAVGERVREIGIRMALGARRADVLRLMLKQGLTLWLAAAALGLGAAWAVGRLLASQLSEVSPADVLSIAGATVLLLVVAAFATYLPARRAMRVDPMVALRHE
jgi:putative ABC transport system permease protein